MCFFFSVVVHDWSLPTSPVFPALLHPLTLPPKHSTNLLLVSRPSLSHLEGHEGGWKKSVEEMMEDGPYLGRSVVFVPTRSPFFLFFFALLILLIIFPSFHHPPSSLPTHPPTQSSPSLHPVSSIFHGLPDIPRLPRVWDKISKCTLKMHSNLS